MQNLISPEISPIIRHAALLSRRGCSDTSETFSNFAYTTLNAAEVLPADLGLEDFSPCEYLEQLQQVLFSTDEQVEKVTYENFVIVPEALNTSLYNLYGNEDVINGQFVSFLQQPLLFFFSL